MQLHPEPGFDTLLSATSTQFCFSASLRFLQLPSTFILANYCGSSRHLQSVPILSALCPASAFGFCLTLFPLKYCFRFSLFPADYLCFCNLHQHLKKSSQSLQHFLEFSFDTVSSFNFHPVQLSLYLVSIWLPSSFAFASYSGPLSNSASLVYNSREYLMVRLWHLTIGYRLNSTCVSFCLSVFQSASGFSFLDFHLRLLSIFAHSFLCTSPSAFWAFDASGFSMIAHVLFRCRDL